MKRRGTGSSAARMDPAQSAELLVYGGRIYPRVDRPPVEALAVTGGRVLAAGTRAELEGLTGPRTRRLDLGGATALPGFADSHLHLVALGRRLQRLDLSHVRNERELLDTVTRAVHRLPPGAWLEGRAYDETRFPSGSFPDISELDAASAGHPVLLTRVCSHVAFANSAALTGSGIGPATPDPPGGRLERDPYTGAFTGLLRDAAIQSVARSLPPPADAELEEAISLASDAALEVGLTAVHSEDLRYVPGVDRTYQLFRRVQARRAHSPRVLELVWYTHFDELLAWTGDHRVGVGFLNEDAARPSDARVDEADAGSMYGSTFAFGGVKLMADGALGGRSAWLREAYADATGEWGISALEPAFMQELVTQAARHGRPAAIHAIGDAAAEAAISAMEALRARSSDGRRDGGTGTTSSPGSSPAPLPHRLIHLQVLAPDLLERLHRLRRLHCPIVADIQPRFVGTDLHWAGQRLGAARLPFAYAWRTLLEAGVHCAGGSDAPVEPVSPISGIHAAVTRQDPAGHPDGGWLPEQRLSVAQALALYTAGPAYAAGEEARSGTLLPGSRADITVLDRDPFLVEPEALQELQVVATVLSGEVAFEAPIAKRPRRL